MHQLKAHEYSRLNILFRNAHAVAKHHLSFRTYTVICKLDKMKGHDIGDSYLNKKAAEFKKKKPLQQFLGMKRWNSLTNQNILV